MRRPSPIPRSLQLIAMPFTFTQDALWPTHQFIRAARRCGYRIDLDDLQALHQKGLLVPLFRVDDVPQPDLRIDVVPNGNVDCRRQAQYAAAEGRLRDPAGEGYSDAWPYCRPQSERENAKWWNGYLYASWQLLDLHNILSFRRAI
jgi:hypothetical protein